MLTGGSLQENKFWNKKQTSDFMITTPKSLQAYFGKTQSKLHIGHLSMKKNITSLSLQDSIESVLSKKLRGVKLCPDSQAILLKQIHLRDKRAKTDLSITLEQLFNCFVAFKSSRPSKMLLSNKLNTNLIKPFMKIYWFVLSQQFVISNKNAIQKELYQVFERMENRNTSQFRQSYEVEQKDLASKNTRILQEADKVVGSFEKKEEVAEQEQQSQNKSKVTTYNYLKSLKSLHPGTMKQFKTGKNIGTEKIVQTKKVITKTAKKIKFKNIHTTNNDDTDLSEEQAEDLCYELGLLISDTDRILRPAQQEDKII